MPHTEDIRRIMIIGAGPGGLCMAIKLREAGIRDFVILEEAPGLGGTWYHNRYPGLCCDIPSYLYSFSFEPKRDWSRPYPPQAEILAYLEDVAAKHEIVPHIRFDTKVEAARWNESCTWHVSSARVSSSRVPDQRRRHAEHAAVADIRGLEAFGGTLLHSARWNSDIDVSGRALAVSGAPRRPCRWRPSSPGTSRSSTCISARRPGSYRGRTIPSPRRSWRVSRTIPLRPGRAREDLQRDRPPHHLFESPVMRACRGRRFGESRPSRTRSCGSNSRRGFPGAASGLCSRTPGSPCSIDPTSS